MTNQEVIMNHEVNNYLKTQSHHHEDLNTLTKNDLIKDFEEGNKKAQFIKYHLTQKGFSNIKNSNNKFFVADGSSSRILVADREELGEKDILDIFDFAVRNEREIWWINNMDLINNSIGWDIPSKN